MHIAGTSRQKGASACEPTAQKYQAKNNERRSALGWLGHNKNYRVGD